jgi:hypothetical protein
MAPNDKGTDKPKAADRRWHAVSVKPMPGACDAATAGKTSRWLSREAPMLPLPGCTRPDRCRCTYQHHDDRRIGGRRAEDIDAFVRPPKVSHERRKRRDRRSRPNE